MLHHTPPPHFKFLLFFYYPLGCFTIVYTSIEKCENHRGTITLWVYMGVGIDICIPYTVLYIGQYEDAIEWAFMGTMIP